MIRFMEKQRQRGTMVFRLLLSQAKRYPALIPTFFLICLGMGGAGLYLIRLARGPYVIWNRTNPEPWAKLDPTYQYKFVAVDMDYKKLKKQGPDF